MVDQAEIHRKTVSFEIEERRLAVEQLRSDFADLPDREKAWEDLHKLTQDKNRGVRWRAADALGSAFQHVPDKKEVWKDLIQLIQDENGYVRWRAADALGSVFQHVPDKKAAWKDLHQLTHSKDDDVRRIAAEALGSVFQHVPDRDTAWKDLIKLTRDKDVWVRLSSNHSLGKASVFKATKAQSEEEFREEMKNAISFFEESSKEAIGYSNPSKFCLPFYRSFYAITFEKQKTEKEVQEYLTEAKNASEGSKNKETLVKAVENLANALTEAHKVQEANLDTIQHHLNTYRQYCDRAADLIGDAAEGTPGAAQVLHRGLPIIDEQIKEIIPEIPEKARAVCRKTQGTPLEKLGRETARSAKELLPINDILALMTALDDTAGFARGWCEYLPTNKKVDACEQLKNLTDMEPGERGAAIVRVLGYVQENTYIPKIQTVHISKTKQEIVRIAVAQISFELTKSFPFIIKKKDEVKTKIFSVLEIARNDGANIVCLPELCLCEEWISEIKSKYPDMIIIGGSFYKDKKNICPLIMESDRDIPHQQKIRPSTFEDGVMKLEERMIPGDTVYRYETQFGKFIILICRDFDDLAHYFRGTDIDMIFCPAFNPANERFQNEAHSHVERTPSYILIANTGLYGGTSIFGQLNNNYFSSLVDGGCKDTGDLTYKLCEVKEGREEVIIADFNLKHKNVQTPTPSNPDEEIRSVENIKKLHLF